MLITAFKYISLIMFFNFIFSTISLYLTISNFSNQSEMNYILILKTVIILILISLSIYYSFKNIFKNSSNVVQFCGLFIFLFSFFHVIYDLYKLGIYRYFDVFVEMARLGYIYPHASIAFGIWNLFVFFAARSARTNEYRTPSLRYRPDRMSS